MIDRLWRAALIVGYRLMRVWGFVRRPSVTGAFVAVWHGGALLVIRNSYRGGETLPSGRIEAGEPPLEGARRELAEEVNLEVDPSELSFALDFSIDFDSKHDHVYFYEWTPDERPLPRVDRREVVAASFVDESDLDARPLSPHVQRYLAWRRER